jgi:hypothetical protein
MSARSAASGSMRSTTGRAFGAHLRALPCVEQAQGDAEVRVVFHLDHLADMLAVLRPYRRGQVSEAERERLQALLARHGFGAAAISKSDLTAPESTQADRDGERARQHELRASARRPGRRGSARGG